MNNNYSANTNPNPLGLGSSRTAVLRTTSSGIETPPASQVVGGAIIIGGHVTQDAGLTIGQALPPQHQQQQQQQAHVARQLPADLAAMVQLQNQVKLLMDQVSAQKAELDQM